MKTLRKMVYDLYHFGEGLTLWEKRFIKDLFILNPDEYKYKQILQIDHIYRQKYRKEQ